MKHEIWINVGQNFAHHFRISVIDKLVVNIKDYPDSKVVFTRLNGPKMVEQYDPMGNVTEERLCYQWAQEAVLQHGTTRSSKSLLWIPCTKK